MSTSAQEIRIVDTYRETSKYLEDVLSAGDSDKNALGFLPIGAFQDLARREQLLVAVADDAVRQYVGHLLYDCRFPRASVLQIFVSKERRRLGAAAALVRHLKGILTHGGYIAAYARVAEDLVASNQFWEAQGFYVQRIVDGGATRRRRILVRAHELATRQLFDVSGVSGSNPLGMRLDSEEDVPLFLLDLNVLYDLGPRRPRNEQTVELFKAERMGVCKLAISSEMAHELQRTAQSGRTDPMQAFARIFPTFPYLSNAEGQDVQRELGKVIFAERRGQEGLAARDESDLRHLVTAIQHRIPGFVTNDSAILDAAPTLRSKYGLTVVPPTAFARAGLLATTAEAFETRSSERLDLLSLEAVDEQSVRELLLRVHVPQALVATTWAAAGAGAATQRLGALFNGSLIGYLAVPSSLHRHQMMARIAIDESSERATDAVRILLMHLIDRTASTGTARIALHCAPNQSMVREEAWDVGFRDSPTHPNTLHKVCCGLILSNHNWNEARRALIEASQTTLPGVMPEYLGCSQQIRILTENGNAVFVPLDTLESMLSPCLMLLKNRPALIVPIQRSFSEPLLGHSKQESLLPRLGIAARRRRHYVSGPQTIKAFQRGAILLFYESAKNGGRGAIVAIARAVGSYLKPQADLVSVDLDASVITPETIDRIGKSKGKTITAFDNVFCVANPVPLRKLQEIGCGRPADLLTTRRITQVQFDEIVSAGTQ